MTKQECRDLILAFTCCNSGGNLCDYCPYVNDDKCKETNFSNVELIENAVRKIAKKNNDYGEYEIVR